MNQILQIDRKKLLEIVLGRFRDLEELTTTVVRRQPGHARLMEMAPELRRFQFAMSAEEEARINKAVQQFESRCHELLDSDTLAHSIQNDPLVAAGVIVALFADLMALPGFGSWLLAPTIMKLLPLGKFDTAKRQFHHTIKETIHEGAMERIKPLHPARARLTLSDSDPLLQALKRCSHDSGD